MYCHSCSLKKAQLGADTAVFAEWYVTHRDDCSVNYRGSGKAFVVAFGTHPRTDVHGHARGWRLQGIPSNESLHSVNWSRCSKTVFVGRAKLHGAVVRAVSCFNAGACQLSQVMELLATEVNEVSQAYVEENDRQHILQSDRASTRSPKLDRASTRSPKLDRASTRSPKLDHASTRSPKLDRASTRSPKLDRASTRSPKLDRASTRSATKICITGRG